MEEVLGFKKKDAEHFKWDNSYDINNCKLVPVHLKSESVTIKWLEKWCKEHQNKWVDDHNYIKANDLLSAVREQAKKEK